MTQQTRIIVADDHPLMSEAISELLVKNGIEVIAKAQNGDEVIKLLESMNPDLLVLDLSMPGPDTGEILSFIKIKQLNTQVIILSAYSDYSYLRKVFRSGIRGYVLKGEPPKKIVEAVQTVASGNVWFSQVVAEAYMRWQFGEGQRLEEQLSDKEHEILTLLTQGLDNATMARKLFIGEQTVRNYTSILYSKLGVKNRAEAIVWAFEHGYHKT